MKKKKIIYLDHAATTKVCPEALEAMQPYFAHYYGNPSSAYEFGMFSDSAMEVSRKTIAQILGCTSEEIFFTSGGTESDNWALTGIALENRSKGNHIITTQMEHPAILNTCKYLKECGFEITFLRPDTSGRIRIADLEKSIRKETILISVMTANNEIGTIQPIREIGAIARKYKILFHTDAVQAYCHIPLNVNTCHIDLLSASSHKFGGPKGVGFLYIRKGIRLHSFMNGGHQEKGMRAGTGNVAGVVGMGAAAGTNWAALENHIQYETMLRNYMIRNLRKEIPGCRLNGDGQVRLPGNINLYIPDVDGTALMGMLDMKGICISTGSACAAGLKDASGVLQSIGLTQEQAYNSVRITLSYENTREEIDTTIQEMKKITAELRKI